MERLPVIFRAERSAPFKGEVTAVFPTVSSDYFGREMTCYDGCHSGCSMGWYRGTRPAKPHEYADLLRTLKGIYEVDCGDGAWELEVRQRISPAMRGALKQSARDAQESLKAEPRGCSLDTLRYHRTAIHGGAVMSTQPSTSDAGGYMGDGQRGAPLGRPSQASPDFTGKLHLARIRLDSGGYAQGGAYWGHGGWLWEAWDDAGEVYLTGRVMGHSEERQAVVARFRELWANDPKHSNWRLASGFDRETAKAEVRGILGEGVRFYR